MKIMLLTDIPPNRKFTAGLVLDQLCRFLPEQSICCFAVVNPDLSLEMTEDLSGIPAVLHAKPDENWAFLPAGHVWSLFSWIGEWWIESRVLPSLVESAVRYGREQKVDAVWAVLQGQTIIRMARPLAESLGVPLHTQVWDPFSWWAKANRLDRWTTRRIQKTFDTAIAKSAACATASRPMAELFRTRFGIKALPVIASHDRSLMRSPDVEQGPGPVVRVGMAGQFYAAEAWNSLIAAFEYAGWQVAGLPVRITVLGPQRPPGNLPSQVEYLGWKSQAEAIDILAKCSLLYCPYPFDPAHSEVSKFSFPSKIPLYLAAGRPIIFHGPDYSSPRQYLIDAAAGVCCGELAPSAIYNEIERLVVDEDFYVTAARNAQKAFVRDFTLDAMYRDFAAFLGLPWEAGAFRIYAHVDSKSKPRASQQLRQRSARSFIRRIIEIMRRLTASARRAVVLPAPHELRPTARISRARLTIRHFFGSLLRRSPYIRNLHREIAYLHSERKELACRLAPAGHQATEHPPTFIELVQFADNAIAERNRREVEASLKIDTAERRASAAEERASAAEQAAIVADRNGADLKRHATDLLGRIAAYELEMAELRYFLGEQSHAAAALLVREPAATCPAPGTRLMLEDPKELNGLIRQAVFATNVVLDIGCGIRPMTFFRPDVHICVEPYSEYVKILQSTALQQPHMVVVQSDALSLLRLLPDNSVDSIFLVDVIEHLEKPLGFEVVEHCERVARRQIAIFTPLGMLTQKYAPGEHDAWGLSGTEWQQHRSGWTPQDFGKKWSFLVCERYHTTSASEPSNEPAGAFWALRTFSEDTPSLPHRVLLFSRRLPPAQAVNPRWQTLWRLLARLGSRQLVCVTSPEFAEFSAHLQPRPTRIPSPYHYISFAAAPTIELNEDWISVSSAIPVTVKDHFMELIQTTGTSKLIVLVSEPIEAAIALKVAEDACIPLVIVVDGSVDLSASLWFREKSPLATTKVITLDEAVGLGCEGLRTVLAAC